MIKHMTVVLADRATMKARVLDIPDNYYMQNSLDSFISKNENREMTLAEVVSELQLTLLPFTSVKGSIFADMLKAKMGAYVDAVIPDKEMANEVKRLWTEVEELAKAA